MNAGQNLGRAHHDEFTFSWLYLSYHQYCIWNLFHINYSSKNSFHVQNYTLTFGQVGNLLQRLQFDTSEYKFHYYLVP